ncbi:MAG: class I SAM-dependent methyltransferase [Comamonadaceae bacterium]|jgi:hypothetical protein|uniref:class I SAM-dependent methyltransferase n=1 Tax=Hydrogenophaga sp. SNF1 TaxID=3098762 RepID=UPI002ACBEAA6|nr:class I SAM-dependent methyltransferase [Hydrogenophaga sp. SNF1]NCT96061.1 class I SAM-dependent methyltransferase [Comamonadaceae bacterium]WQB81682.1 class I SAM-dependent methyltransferase [Hydrogenophaga sp. SNF1]
MSAAVHPLETAALRRWRRLRAEGRGADADAVLWDALAQEPNLPGVHVALARQRWPGPDYRHWLGWFHGHLKPRLYLEIGVEFGHTLRLARPGTQATGVDPAPRGDPLSGCEAPTRLFPCTSAAFFAGLPADDALATQGFDLAFIDGDHAFDAVLDDFIGAERLAAPGAVLLLHDTVPLTAATAGRERRTGFHTGDGWKIVPCLRALRPDLRVVTLSTAPTGLTVVTGLDPSSTRLRERRQAIRESYAALPPDGVVAEPERVLALGPNDPAWLARWLSAAGAR